ncbi:hypothetical protein lerEdw1_015587 [Lerista edwardsae]|nr:hypothetical protein lerEdw1_015587 [Lerista edwardsae]
MKQEKEMLLGFKALGAARSQQFQKTIDSEMQKTGATFQQSLQFLDEQRQLLLTQWQTLQAAAANRQAEETVKLSEAIAQLDGLITEAEGRFKKRKFQELMELPSELEETMNSLSRKNTIAAVTLQKIEGTLSSQLEKGQWESPAGGDTTINRKSTDTFL